VGALKFALDLPTLVSGPPSGRTGAIDTSMTRKALASLLVVGVTGSMAAFGVFSAFSDTTNNAGNTFSTGNVTISDNDAGGAM
jgi:hypothetical protein